MKMSIVHKRHCFFVSTSRMKHQDSRTKLAAGARHETYFFFSVTEEDAVFVSSLLSAAKEDSRKVPSLTVMVPELYRNIWANSRYA